MTDRAAACRKQKVIAFDGAFVFDVDSESISCFFYTAHWMLETDLTPPFLAAANKQSIMVDELSEVGNIRPSSSVFKQMPCLSNQAIVSCG